MFSNSKHVENHDMQLQYISDCLGFDIIFKWSACIQTDYVHLWLSFNNLIFHDSFTTQQHILEISSWKLRFSFRTKTSEEYISHATYNMLFDIFWVSKITGCYSDNMRVLILRSGLSSDQFGHNNNFKLPWN